MTATITEFLEARIAEDESAANDLMGEREGDRMLAECAAKRAIIVHEFEHLEVIDGEWGCCHYVEEIRQGACGSYPLSEMHMRLPIHRALASRSLLRRLSEP